MKTHDDVIALIVQYVVNCLDLQTTMLVNWANPSIPTPHIPLLTVADIERILLASKPTVYPREMKSDNGREFIGSQESESDLVVEYPNTAPNPKPQPMCLQVGKCYWTRNWRLSTPIQPNSNGSVIFIFPYQADIDGQTYSFTTTGREYGLRESENDLIAEFNPPQFVKV